MKLLVFGGTGFLGKNLIQKMLNYDVVEKIYCIIHKSKLNIADSKLVEIHGNVLELSDLQIFDDIDICINLSGIINGQGSKDDIMRINLQGTINCIEFCKRNNINKIIYISSINVKLKKYGEYAYSKILAENEIIKSGLNYIIFRPALIYGNGCKGLSMIESFIKKYGILPIFGDGKKLEQPIYISECVDIIAYYIIRDKWNIHLNIFGKESLTYNEMCKIVAKVLNKKIILIHIPINICIFLINIIEKLKIKLPISCEQLYHINTDLIENMDSIYSTAGIIGDTFENNLKKYLK
ncbi:MAG: NAD-dependent epimerase/dehydratase family protein [Firmicutes bacterium]|nr:NAD-dependent epimerase/dehydratase family protein [Bacillota bacterium]